MKFQVGTLKNYIMKKVILLIVLISSTLFVKSQNVITIQNGIQPVIDGSMGTNEWSDADTVRIDLQDGRNVIVYFKKDNEAFYFLFTGH